MQIKMMQINTDRCVLYERRNYFNEIYIFFLGWDEKKMAM